MENLNAKTTSGAVVCLASAAVQAFRASLRGELRCPGDNGYDESRAVWNAMFDKRPALIVRCAGVSDVMRAVDFSRTHRLPVAVRGGGHNVAGKGACDGGMMLDMSLLKSVRVQPEARTVRADAGLIWRELDLETQAFGLSAPGGTCSGTGITGVTLGGGVGWLMRKHGLAVDNLFSADIVTSDGRLRTASATENPDLFFGLRGTHSNFGVVTSLEYRLHPVGPMVLAGMVLHPLDNAREVLRFYRDYTSQAPDELSAWIVLQTWSDGQPMLGIVACYIGPIDEGEQVVRPLREFGSPVLDTLQTMPYVNAQQMMDEGGQTGMQNDFRSNLLGALSDAAIDTLIEGFRGVTSPYSAVLIEQLGGAVSRVSEDETAFPHRAAPYDLVITPMWADPAESDTHMRWADELWQAMQPFTNGAVYVNYLSNEGETRIKAAYGSNYERLVALKNKYDPLNLFCCNQNIKPTV